MTMMMEIGSYCNVRLSLNWALKRAIGLFDVRSSRIVGDSLFYHFFIHHELAIEDALRVSSVVIEVFK